jgi:glycosyltransferase involved in cell wall biosynthesis
LSLDVSVIVPTYNRANLVAETLRSILTQTAPPREVIVVDDGSTDDTPRVLAEFADRVIIERVPNAGVQAARRIGIERAASEWIALCDSDDIWLPDYLAAQTRLLQASPSINFSFGNFSILRERDVDPISKFDTAPARFWDDIPRHVLPEGWLFEASLAGRSFVFHPIFPSATMFTKTLFRAVGGFDRATKSFRNEDADFTLRCLYRATVGAVPQPLVLIRKHESNVSGDVLRLTLDEIASLRHVRQHHKEAVPYHAIIDSEIIKRSISAADGAFVQGDHKLVGEIVAQIPWRERPLKLHLKSLVAAMPEPLARKANHLLQGVTGSSR